MFEYEAGFYYNHGYGTRCSIHWLITYDGRHFSVREIEEALLPRSIMNRRDFDKKYPPNSFDNPVLYRKEDPYNEDSPVTELVFLKDLPIRMDNELTNQGYEIYAPFIKQIETSNPCLKNQLSMSDFTGQLLTKASVFNDGWEITPQLPTYPRESATRFMNQLMLMHLLVSSIVLSKICNECNSCYKYISFSHKQDPDSISKPTHDSIINQLKQYIDSLNIRDIVDHIDCFIRYAYSYYRGEIDGHYYERVISLQNGYYWVNNDEYLSTVLRLGGVDVSGKLECVGSRHYSEGPVDEEELKRIKQEILDSYTKEEHLGYLLAEWHSTVFHNGIYKHLWDDYLEVIQSALCNYFHFDELFKKFITSYRDDSEKVYYIAIRDKVTEPINQGLKKSTLCNLEADVFDDFLKELKTNVGAAQDNIRHRSILNHDASPKVWKSDRW